MARRGVNGTDFSTGPAKPARQAVNQPNRFGLTDVVQALESVPPRASRAKVLIAGSSVTRATTRDQHDQFLGYVAQPVRAQHS